jgi:hypothetical protein
LQPVKITDEKGNAAWMWAVTQFEDETYYGGNIWNPVARAETGEMLLMPDDDED